MTDDEMLEAYNTAVDAAMDRACERDGFASNMSRESRVAGLRAIERAAAARALEEAADEIFVQHAEFDPGKRMAFHRGADAVYDALRARAEAYRQERGEQ